MMNNIIKLKLKKEQYNFPMITRMNCLVLEKNLEIILMC